MLDLNSHDKTIAKIQFFRHFLTRIKIGIIEERLHSENEEKDGVEDLFEEIYMQYIDLFDDILYFG